MPALSRARSAGPIKRTNLAKQVEGNFIRVALDCFVKVLWSALKASEGKPLKGDFGEDVPRQTSDVMTKPEMLRLLQLPPKNWGPRKSAAGETMSLSVSSGKKFQNEALVPSPETRKNQI